MNYFITIPIFFQMLFLFLRRAAPETVNITNIVSKLFLISVVLVLIVIDSSYVPKTLNVTLFVPLVLELLVLGLVEDRLQSKAEKILNIRTVEFLLLILFLISSDIGVLTKLALLIVSYFLDALRSATSETTGQSTLSFFSSLLCGVLAIGLLVFGIDTTISKAIVLLLIPISFFLLPFSLFKGSGVRQIYSLGHRVFTVLLITEFPNSFFLVSSVELILPIIFIILVVGLLHSNFLSVLHSGRLGIELLLLFSLVYFPAVNFTTLAPNFFWASFFLIIPYLLFGWGWKSISKYPNKLLGCLFILGILPGPFYNIINGLVEHARLTGSFVSMVFYLITYFIFVVAFFARLLSFSETNLGKRSFGPLNSIFLVSSIIIGVILSI